MADAAINFNDIDDLDDFLDDVQEDVVQNKPVQKVTADESETGIELLDDIEEELTESEKEPQDDIAPIKVTKEDAEKAKAAAKSSSSRGSSVTSTHDLKLLGDSLFDAEKRPFLLSITDNDADSDDNIALFDTVKPVKVREKLANVMLWMAGNKSLSRYTALTFDFLAEKGEASKAEVRNHLLDNGVSLGTASSQAGQMTHILNVTKFAPMTGGVFKLNHDSVILGLLGGDEDTDASEE